MIKEGCVKGLLSPFGLLLGPHRAALMIILNTFEAYVFLITTFLFPFLFYSILFYFIAM
jgi:hypothetical protein